MTNFIKDKIKFIDVASKRSSALTSLIQSSSKFLLKSSSKSEDDPQFPVLLIWF